MASSLDSTVCSVSCSDVTKGDNIVPDSKKNHPMSTEDLSEEDSAASDTFKGEIDDLSDLPGFADLSRKKQNKLRRKLGALKHRPEKRKRERERKKQSRQAARERGEEVRSRKMLKRNAMEYSSCHVTVVIDGMYDELMNNRGIMNYVKQIQFSYSANRRADNPMQFYVAGVGSKSKQRLERVGVYRNWDVHFRDEAYYELFDKKKIIYLSSDSSNILSTIDEDKVYIIGGLVDYNHHKGICLDGAIKRGVDHAQLPINDFVEMKTRKVLTVNQVFEIILRYTETKDWQKSISSVIPLRKGAKVKSSEDVCDDSLDVEDSAENSGTNSVRSDNEGIPVHKSEAGEKSPENSAENSDLNDNSVRSDSECILVHKTETGEVSTNLQDSRSHVFSNQTSEEELTKISQSVNSEVNK